jgi:hypothetical protein
LITKVHILFHMLPTGAKNEFLYVNHRSTTLQLINLFGHTN